MNANDSEREKTAKVSKELREERRRTEKLEKELTRKEKALVEAALLVLRKKPKRSGERTTGKNNQPLSPMGAVELIGKVVDSGVALYKAGE